MTSRERWTIYPLLFFALLLGFRSNYQNPLEFRSRMIECQSLVVRDNITVKRINGENATQLAIGTLNVPKLTPDAEQDAINEESASAADSAQTEASTDDSTDDPQQPDTAGAIKSDETSTDPASPGSQSTESATDGSNSEAPTDPGDAGESSTDVDAGENVGNDAAERTSADSTES